MVALAREGAVSYERGAPVSRKSPWGHIRPSTGPRLLRMPNSRGVLATVDLEITPNDPEKERKEPYSTIGP